MGKKKPRNDRADVLPTEGRSNPHALITDWNACPIVPVEVTLEWLDEKIAVIAKACRYLIENKDFIADGTDVEKRQATGIVINGQDFVRLACQSQQALAEAAKTPGVYGDMQSQIFASGLRVGMLYEMLNNFAHGRFKRIWESEDQAETMRAAKAASDAARQREHRRQADEAMAWARDKFPTAAYDEYTTFLKEKAAEKLGKSVDTLDRWLAIPLGDAD